MSLQAGGHDKVVICLLLGLAISVAPFGDLSFRIDVLDTAVLEVQIRVL